MDTDIPRHTVDAFIWVCCRFGAVYPDDFDLPSLERARAICDEPVLVDSSEGMHGPDGTAD